jgi:uncharacterized protein YidB (DUF937 family)
MGTKKLIGAAALAAGVAAGGIAGAMLGTPTVSSAIEAESEGESGDGPFAGPGGPRRPHADLGVAAEAIGVSEDDLRAALVDGQSMAEVAAANGVDAQVVVDALVADATTRIDQAVADGELDADRAEEIKANLVERITALVNGEMPLGGPGGHHRPHANLATAAEAIGISEDDLRAALEDGQTVAEVATANGVDPQVVIDALVSDGTERITAFVNGD